MAHSKQAKKRIRQNEKARLRNKAIASRMRTEVKRVTTAIDAGDKAAAEASLPTAMKLVDKAAKAHVIHANTAARKIGRLQKAIQKIGA
jgi:small subunit ribosomal protein S20